MRPSTTLGELGRARAGEFRRIRAPRQLRAAALTFWISALVVLCCPGHGWAAPAAIAVEMAPSEQGYLGAWLVSGRIPGSAVGMVDPATVELVHGTPVTRGAWWPLSHVIATHDGALNLIQLLEAGTLRSGYAILNAKLRLTEPLTGLFLLGMHGSATFYVNGQKLHEHTRPPGRDRGWDAIPLDLPTGLHNLTLWLPHPGAQWTVETRLLERNTLLPPRGARLVLPGTTEGDRQRLTSQMVVASVEPGLGAGRYEPVVRLSFPRGVPAGANLNVVVSVESDSGRPLYRGLELGPIPVGPRGVAPFVAALPAVDALELSEWVPERFFVDVDVGNMRRRLVMTLGRATAELASRVYERLTYIQADRQGDPGTREIALATLSQRLSDLRGLGTNTKGDRADLISAGKSLERLFGKLDANPDLLHGQRGVIDVARLSVVTGTPERARLFIPKSYDPNADRTYPLVVVLHGYGGSPTGIMRAFLDSLSLAPTEDVDGFVLAPGAHDDAFYRGPGEADVMGAIDWMLREYPIDPDRVSITGVSMGGTGAAQLALFHPERFSAAAPICGYQSYFTRWDVRGKRLRPWEDARARHYSPFAWAENGRNLPLFVAHGTEDKPVENSKVLARRYQTLGFPLTAEWPAWGHSVWEVVYRRQRMWRWLSEKRRVPSPDRVVIKADSLRYASRDFARIDELATWGVVADLDARFVAPNGVEISTASNVRRFSLLRRGIIPAGGAIHVKIAEQSFEFAPGEQIGLGLQPDGSWHEEVDVPEFPSKVPGVEGPIDDVYLGPLVVSYGTKDPRLTRLNREVAESFATYQLSNARYPVLADGELTESLLETHSVIAVGNENAHALLARWGARLPIRAVNGRLWVGSVAQLGTSLGATFIFPNPDHPSRYVVAVLGTDAAGLMYAHALPRLLPDFMVYDGRINAAAGEQVLGSAEVLSAGFFDGEWRLPAASAAHPHP